MLLKYLLNFKKLFILYYDMISRHPLLLCHMIILFAEYFIMPNSLIVQNLLHQMFIII